jgi:DNA polymerase-3 subunit epsilon
MAHVRFGGRTAVRIPGERVVADTPYLARLVAGLSTLTPPEVMAPYVDLLHRALEDRRVTEQEAKALQATAEDWGLSQGDVVNAHHSYLESLAAAALADGHVTATERRDLDSVALLMAIDASVLDAMLYRIAEASPGGGP